MAGSGRSSSPRRRRAKPSDASSFEVAESSSASATAGETTGLDDLVLKYHAMAEELNGRGSMELAVPFYRQAIALLLTEREQVRREVGRTAGFDDGAAANPPVGAISAAVHGVLQAAASAAMPAVELERQLAAIQDSLTPNNLLEAAAALEDLEHRWGQPHAGILALAARLALLEGDLDQAHRYYEQALELQPRDVRLRINTGAARLAMDDPAGAAELLRPLAADADALTDRDQGRAFWKNLAKAEHELGQPTAAVQALLQLLELAPEAFDLEPWLEASRGWMANGDAESALELLEALRQLLDEPATVLPLLAEALEGLGRYREAALVYRDLLRPHLQ